MTNTQQLVPDQVGYQVHDDVHGLVRVVYLPHASRSALRREASVVS